MRAGIVIGAVATAFFLTCPQIARADCATVTDGMKPEAHIFYNSSAKTYQFCDGTVWRSMGGGGGASSGGSSTMFEDFPDAIACTRDSDNGRFVFLMNQDLRDHSDGRIWYRFPSTSSSYDYVFTATGAYSTKAGFAASNCDGKSISQLYEDGQAFDFVGVGPSGSGGVPSGAVMAFDLASCPTGWSEYAPAYGRFVRGIDKSGSNIDPSGQRSPGSTQDDLLASHNHSVDPPSTSTNTTGAHSHTVGLDYGATSFEDDTIAAGNQSTDAWRSGFVGSAGNHSHTVNISAFDSDASGGAETRPKNVALLYCRKD